MDDDDELAFCGEFWRCGRAGVANGNTLPETSEPQTLEIWVICTRNGCQRQHNGTREGWKGDTERVEVQGLEGSGPARRPPFIDSGDCGEESTPGLNVGSHQA